MGNGKAAMQAFLSFPNLKRVVGVELVTARFEAGAAALRALHKLLSGSSVTEQNKPVRSITLTTKDKRSIEFRHDNVYNVWRPALIGRLTASLHV
jgi:hypothetical protein